MSEQRGEISHGQELSGALEKRAGQLHEGTQLLGQELLSKSGEGAAAPFFAAHEALNSIFESLHLRDPQEIDAFSKQIFETVRTMSDAIVMGQTPNASLRQEKIARSSELPAEVRKAIANVTGDVGPNETRFVSDYKLKG